MKGIATQEPTGGGGGSGTGGIFQFKYLYWGKKVHKRVMGVGAGGGDIIMLQQFVLDKICSRRPRHCLESI